MDFQTDPERELSRALDHLVELVGKTVDDPYQWKWAIIAAHHAVRSAMTIALRGGNGLELLTERSQRAVLEAWAANRDEPVEQVAGFDQLLNRVKNGDVMKRLGAEALVPSPAANRSLLKLAHLRNRFEHFPHLTWILQTDGLPNVFVDCLDAVRFLAFECGPALWHDADLAEATAERLELVRSMVS